MALGQGNAAERYKRERARRGPTMSATTIAASFRVSLIAPLRTPASYHEFRPRTAKIGLLAIFRGGAGAKQPLQYPHYRWC